MSIKDVVEKVVADFGERSLPEPTHREIQLPALPGKIDAVIGFRRVGKTWFLFQQIHELVGSGIGRDQVLYVDLEDERLAAMRSEDLHLITEVFFRRSPDVRGRGAFFFFDEIQNVQGWERFVRRLVSEENVRVVVSGSSAKLLSREIATSLRGRSLSTELLPFSFREALIHAGVDIPDVWPPSSGKQSELEHAFESYIVTGGFPEVQGLGEDVRRRVLQEYVDVALFRDVVERHGVTNIAALRYLVRRLLAAPAGRFTINRFYNDLKSQGLRVAKDTVHQYVEHLEDAFLFASVEIASGSIQARRTNPRKAYPVDPALARAMSVSAGEDVGHLLETIVYLELRRRGHATAYVSTGDGAEVDFLATSPRGTRQLIQVCADLTDPTTRDREVRAMAAAMAEHPDASGLFVTMFHSDLLEVAGTEVPVTPAWRWLLEEAER